MNVDRLTDSDMDIDKVRLVFFSPTHTSRKVGEAIARGYAPKETEVCDLTHGALQPAESVKEDTLTVIAVPVYGGHVSPLALVRMKDLHADGAPAIIVVLYGNRAYEKALEELDAFATHQGFKVIAGGTFVGEHSYSSERYPVAAGRPDAADLEYAELFGKKVRTKVSAAESLEKLYVVDVRRIQRPSQPFFPLFRFLRKVVKLRKSGTPMPRIPQGNAERCTHCGRCVEACPAQAIVKGDECNTIAERCIKCCACVKQCPQGARTFDTPFAPLLSDCFKRQKQDRIIL